MKIEFLNAWQGKLTEPITKHLEQASEVDIFCFQEASPRLQNIYEDIFPDYQKVTSKKHIQPNLYFNQATYLHPKIELLNTSSILDKSKRGGLGLAITLKSDTQPVLHVCNVHGVSQPGHKLDTPERIHQSQEIINFMKKKKGPRVIGGDFNLLPTTNSIQMLEGEDYQNLIKDFKIKTTRNRFAWKLYPDNKQQYADYVFVSKDIEVVEFSVPGVEISDHLPMVVEVQTKKSR